MMHSITNITAHEIYMKRCLQLALLGAGNVAPNPMVGSVLMYENRIIGEGYHEVYGQAHAEVNCIASVAEGDKHLINKSTLYVSLEPCVHYGKTPPCADLIIKYNIPRVVIGCRDSYKAVDGKGIEKLQNTGIEVITGILEQEARELNKRFFTFHEYKRPYIILKWAETANHFIGNKTNERLLISNESTNRLVHKWRSEEAAILVGTSTALLDNPSLSNRLWTGKQPIRLVIDRELKLPESLHLFDKQQSTIIFNYLKNNKENNLIHHQIEKKKDLLSQIMDACYQLNIQSILVEGGQKTLQSFIDSNLWDEARIITNTTLSVADGISSPILYNAKLDKSIALGDDRIDTYKVL